MDIQGNILEDSDGAAIATHYRALYYHYVRDAIRDAVTPVHFGDTAPEFINRPTAYYKVSRHEFPDGRTWVVINQHVFHRYDWSDHPIEWVRKLDSHPLDFEGYALFIPESAPGLLTGAPVLLVTQAHYRLEFELYPRPFRGTRPTVVIESRGHAQRPYRHSLPCRLCCGNGYDRDDDNALVLDRYRLVPMESEPMAAFFREVAGPLFRKSGVDLPWEVNDQEIRRRFGKRTDGLWYTDPAEFLRYAVRSGRVSGKWSDLAWTK